jgi:ribosomal protein L37AE/L43A
MNCPYCGRFNAAEDALFCNYCGVRFSDYQYAPQQSQLQYQTPAQDQSAYYTQQTQAASNNASGGQGGEGYAWDNFTKFLNTNTKPKDKPTSGKCGKCGSTQLEFFDSGIGTCYSCGKEFRWDGASKPQRTTKPIAQQAAGTAPPRVTRPVQQPAARQTYQQPNAPYQQPATSQSSSRCVKQAPYQVQGPNREDQTVVALKQKQRSIPTYVQEDPPEDGIEYKEHQRDEETYMEWTDEDDKLFAMEEAEAKEEDEAEYNEDDDEGPVNDIKAYLEKDLTEDDEELAAIEKMIKLKHLLKTKKITEYEYKWWEKKIKGG